VQFKVAFD
jgi:hypothetical protein